MKAGDIIKNGITVVMVDNNPNRIRFIVSNIGNGNPHDLWVMSIRGIVKERIYLGSKNLTPEHLEYLDKYTIHPNAKRLLSKYTELHSRG